MLNLTPCFKIEPIRSIFGAQKQNTTHYFLFYAALKFITYKIALLSFRKTKNLGLNLYPKTRQLERALYVYLSQFLQGRCSAFKSKKHKLQR